MIPSGAEFENEPREEPSASRSSFSALSATSRWGGGGAPGFSEVLATGHCHILRFGRPVSDEATKSA